MKIVCLFGSPRENGNSATIAKRFCDTAERFGTEIQTFTLNKLEFRGCQGCMACKTKLDKCAIEDDLTAVLEAVRETDLLVLATPVYLWDVTSQLKTFFDRTFSFFVADFKTNPNKSRLAPGKKLVFIQVQGNPDESMFTDIFPKFDYFFKSYGFSDSHLIRACGARGRRELEACRDALRLAETMAESLCRP
ncbi:MAG: flavodoxin family protein [Syntrophobacteraceae bacterium]